MNNYNQELNKYYCFLKEAKIISKAQSDMYFKQKNITDTLKDSILTKLCRQKMCYVDATQTYYSASPNINYTQYSTQLEKSIWTYLFFLKKKDINFINFSPKVPACAYFISALDINDFWDRTVFYIPDNLINLSLKLIETNYGGLKDKINTTIIVDNDSYLDEIQLSETFKICEIIMFDNNKKPIVLQENE